MNADGWVEVGEVNTSATEIKGFTKENTSNDRPDQITQSNLLDDTNKAKWINIINAFTIDKSSGAIKGMHTWCVCFFLYI